MIKANWLLRSKVSVPPESGTPPKHNHLFPGPLSTCPEKVIKICFQGIFFQTKQTKPADKCRASHDLLDSGNNSRDFIYQRNYFS